MRQLSQQPDFVRVRSMTPEDIDYATRDYPNINWVSKLLVLVNTDLSWRIFIEFAPEDDIYAIASSNVITARRLQWLKDNIRYLKDVSTELIDALDVLDLPQGDLYNADAFREIVLRTDDIEELKTLYDSKDVFRNILDDPETLTYLARRAIINHTGDLLDSRSAPVVRDYYNNFVDYFIWYTDTFYSSKYCPAKSNRRACIMGAIDRDDVNVFRKAYTAYLADPGYKLELNHLDYVSAPKIANYIITETDWSRAGSNAIVGLTAMFSDLETVKRSFETNPNGFTIDTVLTACAALYAREEPNEEIKLYLMSLIDNSEEKIYGFALYYSFVQGISSLKIRHTRWLSDMTIRLTEDPNIDASSLTHALSRVVRVGLLRYAQYLVMRGTILRLTSDDVQGAIPVIPNDVPPSELKGFISFVLDLITHDTYDTASEEVKRVIDECVEEYKQSNMRTIMIPLTLERDTA